MGHTPAGSRPPGPHPVGATTARVSSAMARRPAASHRFPFPWHRVIRRGLLLGRQHLRTAREWFVSKSERGAVSGVRGLDVHCHYRGSGAHLRDRVLRNGLLLGRKLGRSENLALSYPAPVQILGAHLFTHIAAGGAHACGLTSTGAAYCWGRDKNGEVGNGDTIQQFGPSAVNGGLSLRTISAGALQPCGLSTNDPAYC